MRKFLLIIISLISLNKLQATTFTVTNTNDSGIGSIRQAITDANADNTASAGAPHIIDANIQGSIALASVLPAINNHITINGPSSGGLSIMGGTDIGVFTINGSFVTNISSLIIEGAYLTTSGGGGINNAGNLTLNDCTIQKDTVTGSGQGGGIRNGSGATLILNRCTLNNNSADNTGGAIANYGTATLTNCTIYNNTGALGGAIMNYSTSVLVNCTIVSTGGGVYHSNSGSLSLLNTILIGSTVSNDLDISAAGTINAGYSIFGTVGSNVTLSGTGNVTGSDPVAIYGTVSLSDNGGITKTIALPGTSYAVNHGTSSGAPSTDQRGMSRVSGVDIGSYEYQGATAVMNQLSQDFVKIYSNPGNGNFNIEVGNSITGNFDWKVIDNNGRIIRNDRTINKGSGEMIFPVNISDRVSGTYYLIISTERGTLTKVLVKE